MSYVCTFCEKNVAENNRKGEIAIFQQIAGNRKKYDKRRRTVDILWQNLEKISYTGVPQVWRTKSLSLQYETSGRSSDFI